MFKRGCVVVLVRDWSHSSLIKRLGLLPQPARVISVDTEDGARDLLSTRRNIDYIGFEGCIYIRPIAFNVLNGVDDDL